MDSSVFSLGFNTVELNWILLTVAIIVVYMLGALWYSPILFGDKWAAIINPKFTKPNTEKISFLPMIFQFVATIILGVVVFVGVQISIPLTISMLVAEKIFGLIMEFSGKEEKDAVSWNKLAT